LSYSLIRKNYLARLGTFLFETQGVPFQKLERDSSYDWAKLKIIGSHPVRQWIAPDGEKIQIQGSIYPYFRGGLGQLKKLRDMAADGKPYSLIYADTAVGEYLGDWIVTSIKESRTQFNDDGTPRKIDFTLELESYAAA
jgi:phage protein U